MFWRNTVTVDAGSVRWIVLQCILTIGCDVICMRAVLSHYGKILDTPGSKRTQTVLNVINVDVLKANWN